MQELKIQTDPRATLDLGHILGQRRALVAVGGRCSAAHAMLLRRIHDEKLYLALAPSWRAFCGAHLAISRRHADYLIGLLKRFGPIYFELSQLVGLSVRQYLVIQPAIHDQSLVVDGAAVSLIPENAPKILEAVGRLLNPSQRAARPEPPPSTFHTRLANLNSRGRHIANQLIDLYNSSRSQREREAVLESATELRMLLMQLGLD